MSKSSHILKQQLVKLSTATQIRRGKWKKANKEYKEACHLLAEGAGTPAAGELCMCVSACVSFCLGILVLWCGCVFVGVIERYRKIERGR